MTKFLIHFAFLAAASSGCPGAGSAYYWRTLAWFFGGHRRQRGLRRRAAARRPARRQPRRQRLSPLTGGASQINVYGAIEGASVYRPNALTGDPNHLGIMLIIPLLVLTPIYLRLERGHPLRKCLMRAIAFLLIVEPATLSRSGLLGLAVGALILAIPYRHYLRRRELLVPLAGALASSLAFVLVPPGASSRRPPLPRADGRRLENAHLQVYDFIPDILHIDPLFGLGLNISPSTTSS